MREHEKEDAGFDAEEMVDEALAGKKPKQADVLIGLAREAALFRTPDGRAYADITAEAGHRETWPVRSRGFKAWLRYRYWQTQGHTPNKEAVEAAIAHLEAAAQYDPKAVKRPIYTRIAAHEGKVYFDLADDGWSVIEIDANGWRLAKDPPVRFRRSPGMAPLPMPQTGGSLAPLRTLLNIADADFILVMAWLLAAMRGVKPYPILALTGPPGSAKSTLLVLLRDLIDPNDLSPGALPREVRDLVISGTRRFVMGFDNLSDVPGPISDALCRLSTGGGFSTRVLYSDDEEMVFSDTRPVILAGIEDVVGKPDLSERIIGLTLTEIDVSKRKLESEMLAQYEEARPIILGALLDIVATGLRRLPHIAQAEEKPRLADFAHWMAACETAIPMPTGTPSPAGTFATAYARNRAAIAAMAVESEAVAQAVIAMIAASGEWIGSAKDLLAKLSTLVSTETIKSRDWPRTPRGLSGKLRLATPMLRSTGIEVIPPREGDTRTRTWVIRKIPKAPDPRPRQTGEATAPTAPTATAVDSSNDSNGLGRSDGVAVTEPTAPDSYPTATNRYPTAPRPLQANPLKTRGESGWSDGSGLSPTLSGRPPRAISDSPEDRREVPYDAARAGVIASVRVIEETVIPADAVCCVCGEGGNLWNLDQPGGRPLRIHEECYDRRPQPARGKQA